MASQKKVIVFLTEGTEEMELTITGTYYEEHVYKYNQLISKIVDVLRRAKVDVTVVGVELANEVAVCSRGVKIAPDVKFENTTFKPVMS